MIPEPLVSVIMPSYNRAEFIAQAVESVLAQDYPNWELIIIDDGSVDSTHAVIAGYSSPNIRCLRQDRQGPGAARNRGLAEARGSLIAFLDSDDYFLPGKLRAQAGMLAARKELGALHSGWRKVDVRGRLLETVEPWRNAPLLDLKTWLMWKPVFLGGIMIRAEWLRRAGGFNPRLYQTDDVELMFRLAAAGCRMAWWKQPSVCYRQHAANITRDGPRQADDLMAAVDSFFSNGTHPDKIQALERDVRHYTLLWLAFDLWRKDYPSAMADYLLRTVPFTVQTGEQLAVSWHSHLI
jgi:glycosyltransferase involved in cell wall biosynthesis